MSNDDDVTPEARLDRLLRRERRKAALKWGAAGAVALALMVFAFVIERVPQGPEPALVLSRSLAASDDGVGYDYTVELTASGTRFRISARPVHGINVGDTICVQRLRHPVFGGAQLQRLPASRCAPR